MYIQVILARADVHFGRTIVTRCFAAMRQNVADSQERRQNRASADQFFRSSVIMFIVFSVILNSLSYLVSFFDNITATIDSTIDITIDSMALDQPCGFLYLL